MRSPSPTTTTRSRTTDTTNPGLRTSLEVSDTRFALWLPEEGTQDYIVNNLNQYTVADGQSLTYDDNGNLTGDGTNTYTYDAVNRLQTASGDVSYQYDALDRRERKSVGPTASTTFVYAGDEVVAEYDEAGSLVRKYLLGPGIDEPVYMESGGQQYFYHADALGSVIGLSGITAGLAEIYQYSPYGLPKEVGALGNPYLYTGRRYDPESMLFYYRARYYDVNLRRFLQPDPIGIMGGMNLYSYVQNNPVNFYDPYGLQAGQWTINSSMNYFIQGGQLPPADWGAIRRSLKTGTVDMLNAFIPFKTISDYAIWIEHTFTPFLIVATSITSGAVIGTAGILLIGTSAALIPATFGLSSICIPGGLAVTAAGEYQVIFGMTVFINHLNNLFGTDVPSPSDYSKFFPPFPPGHDDHHKTHSGDHCE